MNTLKFKTNIKCSGCIATVTPKLNALTAEENWQVDLTSPDKVLSVEGDVTPEQVEKALAEVGYKAEIL
ncbi:heavy-metal-associated domain-containing protein [Solitalea canadensis]|uniref:Copper chaperone n=1 Tax=Solitalea canadensis (strain ATCC 29591 / DSM 3403 / JCM 21819 / LMG 8368 / NBRC 15130 / NCIMB 12057 / USAM 9D) TaxID=929556 RepID=H8KUT2_SOLCM|nr:cation transporter [Solitalea canadensis]AFD07566.1 copper chaperone [Solitalea canadensis DSM 3403]